MPTRTCGPLQYTKFSWLRLSVSLSTLRIVTTT